VTDYPANLQSRRLRVSGYDRAWSWLLALLLFIGTAVFILFMVWLSNQIRVTDIAREVDLTEVGDGEGGGDGRPSGGTQLESPDNSPEPIPLDRKRHARRGTRSRRRRNGGRAGGDAGRSRCSPQARAITARRRIGQRRPGRGLGYGQKAPGRRNAGKRLRQRDNLNSTAGN
jgi:hypothetical protein